MTFPLFFVFFFNPWIKSYIVCMSCIFPSDFYFMITTVSSLWTYLFIECRMMTTSVFCLSMWGRPITHSYFFVSWRSIFSFTHRKSIQTAYSITLAEQSSSFIPFRDVIHFWTRGLVSSLLVIILFVNSQKPQHHYRLQSHQLYRRVN